MVLNAGAYAKACGEVVCKNCGCANAAHIIADAKVGKRKFEKLYKEECIVLFYLVLKGAVLCVPSLPIPSRPVAYVRTDLIGHRSSDADPSSGLSFALLLHVLH